MLQRDVNNTPETASSIRDPVLAAARDIAEADHLLIVAAAGLSISDVLPNNPYHTSSDFAQHYPQIASYGYRTAYDAMGLAGDERVPPGVKCAFTAAHFLNMRFRWPPTPGYETLRKLATSFDPARVFCWTSNVDGCFERAGFDKKLVYTVQGEMDKMQCFRPGCGNIWDCESQIRAIDAASADGVLTDLSLVPTCPKCGSQWPQTRPNLRGGEWFDPSPYEETALALRAWLDDCVRRRASVAVIEVGVGPNTPVVTRVPASAFASAVQANGGRATLLRVNPGAAGGERPAEGVAFHSWRQGWQALEPLVSAVLSLRGPSSAAPSSERIDDPAAGPAGDGVRGRAAEWQRRYHELLASLRRPPA